MEDGGDDIREDLENVPEVELHPPKLRRTSSRNSHIEVVSRQVSRQIAEEDEDIIKMKEYMEQKGLWPTNLIMKSIIKYLQLPRVYNCSELYCLSCLS